MGFHVCEYCREKRVGLFVNISGDVYLAFESGRIWQMPDMILHYVADHKFKPPVEFIEDVMNGVVLTSKRLQTRGLAKKVGYLSGDFDQGEVPNRFVEKLLLLMVAAEKSGNRIWHRRN